MPIPSGGPSIGGNTQASFAPEQEDTPENIPFNDQSQSFFAQENANEGQQQESSYPEETSQIPQMNFGSEANQEPENFEGIRGATYENENYRGGNNYEGNMMTTDNNVF